MVDPNGTGLPPEGSQGHACAPDHDPDRERVGAAPATQPVVTTSTMEIVVAGLFLLFGVGVMYDSYRIGARWAIDGPQSGYFPFYIGALICLSSSVLLVQGVRQRMRVSNRGTFVQRGPLSDVLKVLIPAVGYVLGIQLIGVYVASAVYIALFMVFIGRFRALRSTLVGVGVAAFTFVLFELWFRIPLPKGFLERAAGF